MEFFSEHFKTGHVLARADARLKLLICLTLLGLVLSCKGFGFPLFILFLSLGLCWRMGVPLRTFVLRLSEPLFIIVVLVLLKLFFSGHVALFSLGLPGFEIVGHKDGLMEGLIIGCRIAGAVSVTVLLGFSTPFAELMAGLSWLRIPRSLIEILMFAYRYIFVLLEDALVIYNAQKNRLGYSTIRRGLNSFGTLAGALVLKAFEHSQNTTVAMVQRGYDGTMPLLKHKPFKIFEVVCSALFLLAMGGVWKI
jgi:cobalt/nickel transport system permease protein